MFCPYCGNTCADGTVFCGHCGKKLNTTTATTHPPAAPKIAKPLLTKEQGIRILLLTLLAALYIGISLVFLLLSGAEEAITIQTLYDTSVEGHISVGSFLDLLINGNHIFHPTVLSTTLGVAMQILTYAVPVTGLMALLGTILKKKTATLYVGAVVTTGLAAILQALLPLSLQLIPGLKLALSASANLIRGDIDTVTCLPVYLLSGLAVLLVIAAGILTGRIKKRREIHHEEE